MWIKVGNREFDHFKYLRSLLTIDTNCVRKIKVIIFICIQVFNTTFFFASKLKLNSERKWISCYIWNVALR